MSTQLQGDCRLRARDVPGAGRVLEAVLTGEPDRNSWKEMHRLLHEKVAHRSPQVLVLDLRALDGMVGSALLGALVAGARAMKDAGQPGGTRIVAGGAFARRLEEVLRVCGLAPVFGRIHPDLTSALAEPAAET